MATQPTYDTVSDIVEPILSRVCWEEDSTTKRPFSYARLEALIRFIKSSRPTKSAIEYPELVTLCLTDIICAPKSEHTVLRALASKYFKRVKGVFTYKPLDDQYWLVVVEEKTREIHLSHYPTMTRSESNYHNHGFVVGSVTVRNQPCFIPGHVALHKQKCSEITYRILSGKL